MSSRMFLFVFVAATPLLFAACATESSTTAAPAPVQNALRPKFQVQHWGGMREVLRGGQTQGRVALADVVSPSTFAVGALAGLAAEVTIVSGEIHLAEVRDALVPNGLHLRTPAEDDQATLLVAADILEWTEHHLPAANDIEALELSVRTLAESNQIDISQPFPFRIEGTATALGLHVLNHSCPIANPDGPEPWRFNGANTPVVLVGFHATDSAGKLTHHGQSSHIHALLQDQAVSGHLDNVRFGAGARLFLPSSAAN